MRLSIRGRCRGVLHIAGTLLTGVLLLLPVGLTDSVSSGARSRTLYPIVINTASPAASGDQINLARALQMADQDPRDNVIQFSPAILRSATAFAISDPIRPAARAGRDRIEGPIGGSELTIDGSACPDATVMLGDRASLELANLTIQGGRQRAILLKDQARLTIENTNVSSSVGPGLALFGSAQADVGRCRFKNNLTHGIEIHGACTARLQEVEITGSGQAGVAGFDTGSITGDHCRIEGNGHWSIVLTGHSRAQLERCTLAGARFANADISESAALTLRGCTLEKGQRFGLFATGSSTTEMTSGTIRRHASRGIEMQDTARLSLISAEIDSNTDYGAILFEQCSMTALACRFTRNGGHGVSLRGYATGEFKACLFAGNRYSGLGCLDARDGGGVTATQCIFQGNGMRPIYRGPYHLDPLVPTPLSIDAESVLCLTEPNAKVELYYDRAGEASRYFKTLTAGSDGRFRVDRGDVLPGWVITAAASTSGGTSEFNVVAGSDSPDLMAALLAHTGPLSDTGGGADLEGGLRRWKTGTRVLLQIDKPPSVAVERYARFVTQRVADWTHGAVRADLAIGARAGVSADAVVVPVQYLAADTDALLGRGGVTFMKWDGEGYFMSPMRILLATGKEKEETCPRVLAHEFGHVLGLCHVRVGLLSRMQGSMPPSEAFVNDFSPMLTFYDVLALQMLHEPAGSLPPTLRQALAAAPQPSGTTVASIQPATVRPSYSPPAIDPLDGSAPTPQRP